jgi:hypothetical protein
MRPAIPPLPNMPSWHGAQLKKNTGTTLPLQVKSNNSKKNLLSKKMTVLSTGTSYKHIFILYMKQYTEIC